MGKKSKRKSTKPAPCNHGCLTKKDFNSGEHYKVLEDWNNKRDMDEFVETHKLVMQDPTFGNFVLAHITDDYLKGKNDAMLVKRLFLFLYIRYKVIPEHAGKDIGPESEDTKKCNKYMQDIQTDRGTIKCIVREIPCKCMEEKRIAAKLMEKTARCQYCNKEVSKKKMLRCKGCAVQHYCSEACSIQHWPVHKDWCKRNTVSSALASVPGSGPFVGTERNADNDENHAFMM